MVGEGKQRFPTELIEELLPTLERIQAPGKSLSWVWWVGAEGTGRCSRPVSPSWPMEIQGMLQPLPAAWSGSNNGSSIENAPGETRERIPTPEITPAPFLRAAVLVEPS